MWRKGVVGVGGRMMEEGGKRGEKGGVLGGKRY